MIRATFRARPFSLFQRQRRLFHTKDRAEFAAGKPTIRHDNHPATPGSLVFQLPPALEKTHVGNGARQVTIAHNAFHVQTLDTNGMKTACQIGGEPMNASFVRNRSVVR